MNPVKQLSDQDIIWEYFMNPQEQEEEQLQEKWFEDHSTLVDSNSFTTDEDRVFNIKKAAAS